MEYAFLIIYKNADYIEGLVFNKEDFKTWLKEHNKIRVKQGEIIEEENEFILKKIKILSVKGGLI